MYLYYDRFGTLKTIIPHGEPVRQGGTLNVYVCFDTDRTDLWSDGSWNSSKSIDLVLTNRGKIPSMPIVNGTPEIKVFKKTTDSEITYNLINGKPYIVVPFTVLGSLYTQVSGELWLDFMIKTTNSQSQIISQEVLGRAKVFIQKSFFS